MSPFAATSVRNCQTMEGGSKDQIAHMTNFILHEVIAFDYTC